MAVPADEVAAELQRPVLETRVLLGFVLTLAFLVLVGIAAWHNVQRFVEISRWVAHTHEVVAILQRLHVQINQIEATQRGFLLTDNAEFLQRRDEAVQELRLWLQELVRQTADNPRQQERIPEISRLLEGRLAFYDRVLAAREAQDLEAMRQLLGGSLQRTELVRLREVVRGMEREEQELLRQRTQAEERRAYFLLGTFAVLLALLATFLAVLFRRMRRDLALRQQVAQEQARLTAILDASPDLIATATLDGKYFYLNRGGRRMLGIGEHEDVTRLAASFMRPQWAIERIHKEAMPTAINTGSWIGETAFINRAGEEIPVSQVVVAHYAPEGTPTHFSTIARDIRQQKQAERAVAEAACYDRTHGEMLRIFNATFERGRLLQDMLDILAASHPMPVSAVYLYDEWSGSLRLAASHAPPAGIAAEIALGSGLVGEAALHHHTVTLEPAGQAGEWPIAAGVLDFAPATVMAVPIAYLEKCLGVLVVAASRVLTERDRQFLERLTDQLGMILHNLRQYEDLKLLAEQLRLRSEEINSKNARLEEASRMKSEFLANMSHELRTPLNAIIGFSEVMRDGMVGELNDKQREFVTDIHESGQHLLALINDVLDLSKIEAGRMELSEESTDIGMLLHNSLAIVKEKAATHQVRLNLDVPEDLGACWLDPRKVKQMVFNLLSNAVKFTPAGGEVTLRARLASGAEARHTPAGMPEWHTPLPAGVEKFLVIEVCDTGIGIAADDMTRLFQPFVQIDSALSRRYEGTGLGLVMVRRLAELHGGGVGMASQPGKGSIFTVWLPYHTAAPAGPVAPAASGMPAAAMETAPLVLVIEDDDKAAELIRLQLEADDCRVVRTATAETALDLLSRGEVLPDLISLDILLPGMDGWEFLACLKGMPRYAHIPVVILSIVADGNRNRGLALGAADMLQKPVSAESLEQALAGLGILPPGKSGDVATVLVIDDDPKAVEIVATHLEHAGYRVLRAYGGGEGIQMARASVPDLIVLDLMMPEVSGFDVVEALKLQPGTAGIPILVLTAKMLTAQDREHLNGHVRRIMQKSEFNHGNFIGEVRRALARRRGGTDAATGYA